MNSQNSTTPLIVFAKAPIAGKVKTRLQPQLDEQQAAEVAKLLLAATLSQVVKYWPGKVILSAGIAAGHPFLLKIASSFEIEVQPQPTGDLGQRMAATMNQFGYPAAIIGSDIPQITQAALESAHADLINGCNIIGPSDDGGYYLVGLAELCPGLFEGITWGGKEVLTQSLQRARELTLDLRQLPLINDVDTHEELMEAATKIPMLQRYLNSIKSL